MSHGFLDNLPIDIALHILLDALCVAEWFLDLLHSHDFNVVERDLVHLVDRLAAIEALEDVGPEGVVGHLIAGCVLAHHPLQPVINREATALKLVGEVLARDLALSKGLDGVRDIILEVVDRLCLDRDTDRAFVLRAVVNVNLCHLVFHVSFLADFQTLPRVVA